MLYCTLTVSDCRIAKVPYGMAGGHFSYKNPTTACHQDNLVWPQVASSSDSWVAKMTISKQGTFATELP